MPPRGKRAAAVKAAYVQNDAATEETRGGKGAKRSRVAESRQGAEYDEEVQVANGIAVSDRALSAMTADRKGAARANSHAQLASAPPADVMEDRNALTPREKEMVLRMQPYGLLMALKQANRISPGDWVGMETSTLENVISLCVNTGKVNSDSAITSLEMTRVRHGDWENLSRDEVMKLRVSADAWRRFLGDGKGSNGLSDADEADWPSWLGISGSGGTGGIGTWRSFWKVAQDYRSEIFREEVAAKSEHAQNLASLPQDDMQRSASNTREVIVSPPSTPRVDTETSTEKVDVDADHDESQQSGTRKRKVNSADDAAIAAQLQMYFNEGNKVTRNRRRSGAEPIEGSVESHAREPSARLGLSAKRDKSKAQVSGGKWKAETWDNAVMRLFRELRAPDGIGAASVTSLADEQSLGARLVDPKKGLTDVKLSLGGVREQISLRALLEEFGGRALAHLEEPGFADFIVSEEDPFPHSSGAPLINDEAYAQLAVSPWMVFEFVSFLHRVGDLLVAPRDHVRAEWIASMLYRAPDLLDTLLLVLKRVVQICSTVFESTALKTRIETELIVQRRGVSEDGKDAGLNSPDAVSQGNADGEGASRKSGRSLKITQREAAGDGLTASDATASENKQPEKSSVSDFVRKCLRCFSSAIFAFGSVLEYEYLLTHGAHLPSEESLEELVSGDGVTPRQKSLYELVYRHSRILSMMQDEFMTSAYFSTLLNAWAAAQDAARTLGWDLVSAADVEGRECAKSCARMLSSSLGCVTYVNSGVVSSTSFEKSVLEQIRTHTMTLAALEHMAQGGASSAWSIKKGDAFSLRFVYLLFTDEVFVRFLAGKHAMCDVLRPLLLEALLVQLKRQVEVRRDAVETLMHTVLSMEALQSFLAWSLFRGQLVKSERLKQTLCDVVERLVGIGRGILIDLMDEIEMPSFERVLQELEAGSTFEEPETNDEFVAFFVAFVRLFSLLSAKDDFVTLKFLLKAKFSSKQKFEHLFVYLFVLHRVIVPDKLAQKELGQFCLAFRFCNQYYTLHFMADARGQDRRRHKLIVEADEVMASGGVGGRGDGHHGGGGAEEDGDGEEQGTAEDASLKDVLSRWHVDLAGRKVDYTGAMRCLASEYDSRLVRLTGEGDIPAEYVKLKRNVYVGDAKKFDKDDSKTQHVCECVHVPGHPSCDDEMCANVSTKVECVPESCPARDSCKNQRFQTQAYAKFSRRKVPEGHKGFAMYADEDISSGTLVAEYQGEVITAPEFRRRKDLYRDEYNFYFMTLSTDPELFIDASRKSCIARFINHSCDPNCRTDKWTSRGRTVVGIFAIRDISRGTELSFDYRTDPVRGDRAVRCECGTDKCRGWLTGGPEGEIEDKANSLQGTAKAKGKAAVPAGGASAAGTASSSAPGPMKNPPSPRSQKIKDLAKMKRDAMKELDLEEIGVGRMSSERREAEDRRFVATQGGNQFAEGSDTDMRDVETDEELDNVRLSLSNTDCETAANVQSSVVLGSVVRTDIDAGRHAERTTDSLGSGALVDIGRDDDFVIPRLASGLAETKTVPVVAPLSGEVDALDESSPSDRRESFNPDSGSTPTFGFRDIGTGGTPRKVTAFGRMRENPFLHGEHSPAGLPALGRSTARERQPDDDGRSMNVEPNIRWRERRIRALGAPLMYGDDMDPYRKRPRREPTPEEQEMELHPDTRDQAAFDLATYERRLTNQPRGSRPMYGASPGAGRPFDSRPAASPRRPENRRFTPAAGTGVPGFGVRTFVEDEQTRAPPDIEYDSDGFAIPPASYGRQRLPPREAQIEREAQMERNRVNKLRAGWHQRLGGNRRDHRDVRGDTDRNRRADRYADGRSDRERDQYMDRERDQPRNRDSRHDIERDKFQDRGQEWNRDVRRGARYKERSIGDSGEYQDLGDANSPEASPRKLNRSGSPNHVKSNLGGTHRYSAVDRRPSFAHEGNDRKRGDLRERIVGRKESAGGPSEGAPSFGAPQSPRPRSMTYSERHASSEPGAATPSAQHGRNELRRDTDDVHDASPRSGRDDRQQPREDRAGSSAPRSDVNSSRGPQIDPSTSRALSAQHEGREESLKARVPAPPQKASGQVIVDDIRSILSARGSGQHKELPGAAREGPYVPPVKGARSNATSSYFSRSMTPGELDSSLQESASMDNPVRRNSFSGKKGRKDRRR